MALMYQLMGIEKSQTTGFRRFLTASRLMIVLEDSPCHRQSDYFKPETFKAPVVARVVQCWRCVHCRPKSFSKRVYNMFFYRFGSTTMGPTGRQERDGGIGLDGEGVDLTTTSTPIPLFKLTPGMTESSHGIACAKVAGKDN